MDNRNFIFMFYGFTAAWLIVFLYVLTLSCFERADEGTIGMASDEGFAHSQY
jgi:hypothetical protein